MGLAVDVVTGSEVPKYTQELLRRFPPAIDCRALRSKAYANTPSGNVYRLVDHPLRVRRERRRGALLHVDSQMLGYVLAFPQAHPRVITCHDLVPFIPALDDPSYVSRVRPLDQGYDRVLARGLRKADRIIAVSQFVKEELGRLGIDLARVDVVPQGVDLQTYRTRDRAECLDALRRQNLPTDRPIVLFVGTEHPRKNILGLIRAFALAAKTSDAILVKVGAPRHPQREELLRLVASLGLSARIRFLDRIPEDDLPRLYGAASVLVLPSLYEGFGLPPLEAMACGTPIVTSNTTSMPEVVGDAGILVNPARDEEIADGMVRVLTDPVLSGELRARGLARARLFPWERTVEGVLGTYDRARRAG